MIKSMKKIEYEIQKSKLEIERANREVKENQEVINQLTKESEEFKWLYKH